MPEGDTVWRTCRRLNKVFAGRHLARAELRWGRLIDSDLVGMTTIAVVPRGKHILHRLESGLTIHSHLKMEGSWRIYPPQRPIPSADRVRAVLGTQDWTALGTRLGMLDLVETDHEDDLVGHLGPDILGPDWDLQQAIGNLREGARGSTHDLIGASLLDQRNLAGLGTIWTSDPLWVERIHPWTPIPDLSDADLARLLTRAKAMITAACQGREPTPYTHGRSGHPCPRCRETLRVAMAGPADKERTLFYCPRCQGGLAPTDSGTSQAPLGARRLREPRYRKQR